MVSHIWPRVRGSRPVVGSSRKIRGGRVIRLAARSRRRRMPPEKCLIGLAAASWRSNCSSSRAAVGARLGPAEALEPAEQVEVLGGGEQLVDRGVLAGDAQQLADDVRLAAYVDPEDLRVARLQREQGGQHLHQGGLAGAVGAEHTEDLTAADLEVDAVDGAVVAEGLDQAVGGDRRQLVVERGVGVHGGHPASLRFHGGFTAVSPPDRHYARRVTGLNGPRGARRRRAGRAGARRPPDRAGAAAEHHRHRRGVRPAASLRRGVRRVGARRRHLGAGPRGAARRPALPRHRGGAGRGLRDGGGHRPRHAGAGAAGPRGRRPDRRPGQVGRRGPVLRRHPRSRPRLPARPRRL